jgi:hypothetical protein
MDAFPKNFQKLPVCFLGLFDGTAERPERTQSIDEHRVGGENAQREVVGSSSDEAGKRTPVLRAETKLRGVPHHKPDSNATRLGVGVTR